MSVNYKKLGDYIQPVDIRNSDLKVSHLLGLSIEKCFIESIANTIGTDFRPYKIVKKGQFAYGPVTSRNGDKITIALLKEVDVCIISSSYSVFEIIDTSKLLPDYLMLWFSRPEFDRYARYKSHGSVREIFDWDEMCRVELPIPDIKEQQKIVDAYNSITKRIQIKQKINENLSNLLSCLYAIQCSKKESENWKDIALDDIIENKRNNVKVENIPNNSIYVGLEHIPRKSIVLNNHGSTEEVLSDKLKASKGDILFGKIRPYFHKVSVNPYDEIYCSGDALVFNSKQKELYGFVLLTIFSERFVNYAVKLSNGAKMPRAEWKDLKNYTVRVPNTQILNALNEVVNKSLEYIYSNLEEIAKLQELKQLVISRISGM